MSSSSHVSKSSTIPSPHIAEHKVREESEMHEYPVIKPVQDVLHPLPSVLFPSSQVSVPTLCPSPQKGVHVEGKFELPPVQFHVDKEPVQFPLHPSVLFDPSSQASSGLITIPSPHIGQQIEGLVGLPPEHTQLAILPEQSVSHPVKAPASHVSPVSTFPFPQFNTHLVVKFV